MIKAIIFDCFGVLTTDAWLPFKFEKFGNDPEKFEEAGRLNALCDSGRISYDQFTQLIGDLSGYSGAQINKIISKNIANTELLSFIKEHLKPLFKLGLLSNAGANWLDELIGSSNVVLFDVINLSCQTGYIKPNISAYTNILFDLKIDNPEDCLFIDDQERYCDAAKALGLQVIVHKSNLSTVEQINNLLAAESDS
ncbi:MAG: HAD-IA family hydrolase [bacterium]|nr:HAD-IA family hydrolase [bacterium]